MKVGVFDSGIGGLTIFKSVTQACPQYDYIYLGDNARTPYGNRSFETILNFTTQAVDTLFSLDCKIIILACNTASAKALRTIQQFYLPVKYPDRRVLGVIRPSAEKIAVENQDVAIWGTQGTISSQSYPLEIEKLNPQLNVIQQACPLLVPLIENLEGDNQGSDYFIKKYWEETLAQSPKIQSILLACTHYPLLQKQIEKIIPSSVKVFNQSQFVAPAWSDYLRRHPELESCLTQNQLRNYLTTESPVLFNQLVKRLLKVSVRSKQVVF